MKVPILNGLQETNKLLNWGVSTGAKTEKKQTQGRRHRIWHQC